MGDSSGPVSYTHLDVYKRQRRERSKPGWGSSVNDSAIAIAVAVEQMKGALVFMLSKYEPLHLYPVPPAYSASFQRIKH